MNVVTASVRTHSIEAIFAPINGIEFGPDGRSIVNGTFSFTGGNGLTFDGNVNRYNNQLFIEGDFMASWNAALQHSLNTPRFNILGQNCKWLAIDVLRQSTDGDTNDRLENLLWNRWVNPVTGATFDFARNTIVPNWTQTLVKEIMNAGGFSTTSTPNVHCDIS